MADNDRFIIQKVEKTKCAECKFKKYEVCERDENGFMLCPITNKTVSETVKLHRGKTRAEYKDMITEVLVNEKIIKSGRGLNNHTIGEIYDIRTECKKQSKAVVDRLFGENK